MDRPTLLACARAALDYAREQRAAADRMRVGGRRHEAHLANERGAGAEVVAHKIAELMKEGT